MSILNLLNSSYIFKFKILFSKTNDVKIVIKTVIKTGNQDFNSYDYFRLWISYTCKILYNLNYPNNNSSIVLINLLREVIKNPIGKNVDCFKLTNIDDVITGLSTYDFDIEVNIDGTYYEKEKCRFIETDFSKNITEQQVVFSCIAMLQYTFEKNKDNQSLIDYGYIIIYYLIHSIEKLEILNLEHLISIPIESDKVGINLDVNTVYNLINREIYYKISNEFTNNIIELAWDSIDTCKSLVNDKINIEDTYVFLNICILYTHIIDRILLNKIGSEKRSIIIDDVWENISSYTLNCINITDVSNETREETRKNFLKYIELINLKYSGISQIFSSDTGSTEMLIILVNELKCLFEEDFVSDETTCVVHVVMKNMQKIQVTNVLDKFL